MSTAIGEKRLSTKPAEQDARQRARQSKAHPDCRSTTIKSRVTKISLALSSGRDNHPPAATAQMAILIVAVFSSRLSRYTIRHNGLQLCGRVMFWTEAHAPKDRPSPNQARKSVPADKPSCSQEPPAFVQTAAAGSARLP